MRATLQLVPNIHAGCARFPVPLGSYHKFPRGTKAPSNSSLSAALQGPNTVSRTFRLHAIQRRLQFPADVVRRRPVPQPRRQSLAQHLLGKRLLRNRAVIIRKAELTVDIGYRVRVRFPIDSHRDEYAPERHLVPLENGSSSLFLASSYTRLGEFSNRTV